MKALVTGGCGFIGCHLVNQLIGSKFQVAVLDQTSSSAKNSLPKRARFYQQRIEDSSIEQVFEQERPDYVFHLAAQVSVQQSMNDPVEDCLTNIVGTLNLLMNCQKYRVKKIIFSSSAAVYGEPTYLPIDELHPLKPLSYYALSKKTAEDYIKLFHHQYGLNFSILRFSNVYGPGQNAEGEAGVISIFIDRLLKNLPPTVYGGQQTRDFVYVQDVVRALVTAAEKSDLGIYNISSNTETSIEELLTVLLKLFNNKQVPVYQPSRTGDIVKSCLDNQKAIYDLKWNPEMSLEEGLQATIETARAYQEKRK